jgi:hypothetical protein
MYIPCIEAEVDEQPIHTYEALVQLGDWCSIRKKRLNLNVQKKTSPGARII